MTWTRTRVAYAAMPETGREPRRVFNAHSTPFLPYDLEGPVQPEMSWLPVSFDRETGQGCYLMRMQPGAVTIAHEHQGMEEFLILEGDLVDLDGTVFGPGDFVSYEPGTRHNSHTETGCLLAVFEWRRP
jgi:anti-sigma factor ChrR (cupin superfamily)